MFKFVHASPGKAGRFRIQVKLHFFPLRKPSGRYFLKGDISSKSSSYSLIVNSPNTLEGQCS